MSKSRAADFLRSMSSSASTSPPPAEANPSPQPVVALPVSPQPAANRNPPKSAASSKRDRQRHLGGYVDEDDPVIEKFAVLRARLKLDNSELIKLAIEDLYAKHVSKRAFEL
jgi:hypothetical protein